MRKRNQWTPELEKRQRKFMAEKAEKAMADGKFLLVSPVEPPPFSMAWLNQAAETQFSLIENSKGRVIN